MLFQDATTEEINAAMEKAWQAFQLYRNLPLASRAAFMRAIAQALEQAGDQLIQTAMAETHLPEARLCNERGRTMFQLNSYAAACEQGDWLDARIDTAEPNRNPPKPDLRKMLVPLGPVVVFGSSNFPFAYSTAGGDTASALAAGCPVIVKAHPAHPQTSQLVAEVILAAAAQTQMPDGVFMHLHGKSHEVGKQLTLHPHTAAIGFTGSYSGGKALFDWAAQRSQPIPVFAEMGSVNPVFLLAGKLENDAEQVAASYAASITLGVGQFCTNPGLIIGLAGKEMDRFTTALSDAIRQTSPGAMLHAGIAAAYAQKSAHRLEQQGVQLLASAERQAGEGEGQPILAMASGAACLANPKLQEEVFGPFSLIVQCNDMAEMMAVARSLQGQLSATLMATEDELMVHEELVEAIHNICGRLVFNGVPTGVEVCLSMHHGGPFPASTDSRFSSVGADGIRRFARPLCYQNWPHAALPDALKNENPLGIWRKVNDELSKGRIEA